MMWKAIGCSVAGTSHIARNKPCEDAVDYRSIKDINGNDVLVCCVSDGAGSARYAAHASSFTVRTMTQGLCMAAATGERITEADVLSLTENIYDGLLLDAEHQRSPLNEYSCTLLGCCITTHGAVFFQIGDGAIVINEGSGSFNTIWWPDNGEYHNYTSFLVDDPGFGKLNIRIIQNNVSEVAIFSDGLQMIALAHESKTTHQPFFNDLFRFLRSADDAGKVNILNKKLDEYLNSKQINDRTDDDKTLFLATRLS